MPEDPSPASPSRRRGLSPWPTGATGPVEDRLLTRVAPLIGRAPRGGASAHDPAAFTDAFLSELSRRVPLRGWLIAADTATGHGRYLPAGEGPVPVKIVEEPGSLVGNALHHRHPAVVHHLASLPDLPEKPYLVRSGGAWSFLPVVACGQAVACLILRASVPETLTPECLREIREALPILGVALAMARLQGRPEEEGDRTSEIATLLEFGRDMAWVLSTEDLFRLLGDSIGRSVRWDVMALTTAESGRTICRVRRPRALPDALVSEFEVRIRGEVAALAAVEGEEGPFLVERTDSAAGEGARGAAARLRSVMHLPLRVRQRFAGLISLGSLDAQAWDPASTRLLQALASQTSLTLDRLLAASEAERIKVSSMLESMSSGVVLLDRRLRILLSNRAARGWLGEITGVTGGENLTRIGRHDLAAVMDAFAIGRPGPQGFEVAPVEGRVYTVSVSPVLDAAGDAEGMVVVISDVSEARRIQEQLAHNEKLTALGELASGVAHELNNPLASVLGNAELLRTERVAPAVEKKIRSIEREAERCRRIVESLLRFVRGGAPVLRPLDLNTTIDDVITRLGGTLASEGIEVHDAREEGPLPVSGDDHLLGQVLYNIVNNARHAMAESARPRTITIRTRRTPESCVIECSDTGPGIPPDRIGRIFDPFFTTKRVGQGTGLGLSLSYGTVAQHGGTLRAVSPPGEGATFILDLPAIPEGDLARATTAAQREEPAPGSTGATGRVLVVEDEVALAEVIEEYLVSCGHAVDVAHDVRTALQRVEQVRYDAILSDMKMPDMSGQDLYERVREMSPDLAARIIFSTGDSANPETIGFFERVGNRWLTKPFNLTQLSLAIASVIGPHGDGRLPA